jgi:two-component system OmpR family response regulator
MRVLVAEDQLQRAALLKRGLSEDGHTVDVALSGDDALWHATEFSYDAVVVDVMLPGAGGGQLCGRLQAGDRRVPVLMLTNKEHESGRVRGLESGADAYLVEPFSFYDFTAQLAAITHQQHGIGLGELRVGDLRMNPAADRVWRGSTELSLSSREFALLRLFLSHPGLALSREHIFERIWDCTHYGSSNLVDQYVLYLRRKVDRPFAVEQLETVRGAGYRLRTEPIALESA